MAEAKGPPKDLASLFGAKAKKKPKAVNMNAVVEKPPEPEKKPRPIVEPSGAELGWERALRNDTELLKSCGLWIKEVESDGACLFRAFADQLDGNKGADHASYRERCVDFLVANRSDFEPFLSEDFGEYCKKMRSAAEWGGQIEVQALARALGVNAVIWQPTEAGKPQSLVSKSVEVVSEDADSSRCVQLSFHPQHHSGSHYNSVRCVDDDGKGPAPSTSLTELKRRIEDALKPPEVAKPAEGGYDVADDAPVANSKNRSRVF